MIEKHSLAARLIESAILSGEGLVAGIRKLQSFVWEELPQDDVTPVGEILRELAYNLEYFDSNSRELRVERPLYGDEKAKKLLSEALSDIRRQELS